MDSELILLEGFLDDIKKGFGALSAKAKTLGTSWMLKKPREIIELALNKYKNDYMKAYQYLKNTRDTDLDKEDDPQEYSNMTQTLKAFRQAIMKASGKDPEPEDEGKTRYERETQARKKMYTGTTEQIAKRALLGNEGDPKKAASYLSKIYADDVRSGILSQEDEDKVEKAINQLKASIKPAETTPTPTEAPAVPGAAPASTDFGALITKDKTYNDRATLKDSLVKKINALPEDKKAALLKAMQDKPDAAMRIAYGYLKAPAA